MESLIIPALLGVLAFFGSHINKTTNHKIEVEKHKIELRERLCFPTDGTPKDCNPLKLYLNEGIKTDERNDTPEMGRPTSVPTARSLQPDDGRNNASDQGLRSIDKVDPASDSGRGNGGRPADTVKSDQDNPAGTVAN